VEHPPVHVARELDGALRFWALPPAPGPILEFGSGTGRLTKPLLDRGYMVTAIEPDARAQAALYELAHAYPGQLTIQATPPVEAEPSFAAALGVDVLHHAPPRDILSCAVTQLRPGGVVAFDEPDGAHIGWWTYVTLTGRLSNELGLAHASRRSLARALTAAGCTAVRSMRWAPGIRGSLGPRWFYAAIRP
jgi:SAM-dependent methyltransferase